MEAADQLLEEEWELLASDVQQQEAKGEEGEEGEEEMPLHSVDDDGEGAEGQSAPVDVHALLQLLQQVQQATGKSLPELVQSVTAAGEGEEGDDEEDVRSPYEMPAEVMEAIQRLLQAQSGDRNAIPQLLLQQLCEAEGVQIEVETETKAGAADDRDLRMHRAAFNRDSAAINALLRQRPIQEFDFPDHRGNTPLLLAIKLGYAEIAELLVRSGANCDVTSDGKFHLLDEAVLTGDEPLVRLVYAQLQRAGWNKWVEKRDSLLQALEAIPDFYLELTWNFESYGPLTPLVRAFAPSDTYCIWKKGSWIRMDSTIASFGRNFKINRGNISLVFQGANSERPGDLLRLDREKRTVSRMLRRLENPTPAELERATRKLLRAGSKGDMQAIDLSAANLVIRPALDMRGRVKEARVQEWHCKRYVAEGDVRVYLHPKPEHHLSTLTAEEYFNTGAAETPEVTRTKFNKHVQAKLWLATSFPIALAHILPALDVLSMNDKYLEKLKEFFATHTVPDGHFPVKVQLPLFFAVDAVVTFRSFNCDHIPDSVFHVPEDYELVTDEHSDRQRKQPPPPPPPPRSQP